MPTLACGQYVHHDRISASSVVACSCHALMSGGVFSLALMGKTLKPRRARPSAVSSTDLFRVRLAWRHESRALRLVPVGAAVDVAPALARREARFAVKAMPRGCGASGCTLGQRRLPENLRG